MAGQVVTQDGFRHSMLRSLLMQLFVPSRLKALEQYLGDLSDELIDTFSQDNRCELMRSYAIPYATLLIADFFGVPEEDRSLFRDRPADLSGDASCSSWRPISTTTSATADASRAATSCRSSPRQNIPTDPRPRSRTSSTSLARCLRQDKTPPPRYFVRQCACLPSVLTFRRYCAAKVSASRLPPGNAAL